MQPSDPEGEMTIGELAERFGLATHVLRHWEAVGLLAPAARVSGRRRYRREHIARVAMILRGKEAGFSLDQLREVLDAPDSAARRALLERHHAALERRIAQIQVAKELVEHVLDCPAADFTRCPDFQRMAERGAGAGLSGAADGRRPRGEGAGQRAPREWGAISERQYRGLRHAQERGSIARREYAALTGVSERTALNDLSALVRKGLLEATGGRGWRAAYRVRDAAR